MSVTATITGDCRHMSITMAVSPGQAQITLSNGDLTWYLTATIPQSPSTWNTVIDLSSTIGTRDGIFVIKVQDASGTEYQAAAMGDCALNCCISKKLDTILGCDCHCSKCSHHLITAERVNLLILAVKTTLQRVGDDLTNDSALIENAKKKYMKAMELCSDSCGCSC
jgi:hypothetical protein